MTPTSLGRLTTGAISGAAGTLALDVTSYADMLLSGRPASDMPARAAREVAATVGLELSDDAAGTARSEALGALLGHASGLAAGCVYSFVARPGDVSARRLLGLSLVVMAANNAALVAYGLTDPRTWGKAGWVSDAVPHLAYGVVTASVQAALAR